jgi:hypothetical protein
MKYLLDVKVQQSITLPGNLIRNKNLDKYVSESLESGKVSLEDFKRNRF